MKPPKFVLLLPFGFRWTPMGLAHVNRKLAKLGELLVDYGGVTMILFMIAALWYMVVEKACPEHCAASGNSDCDCGWLTIWAVIVIMQIVGNLVLFHYYSKQNCVSHWQRQSCVADLCREESERDSNPHLDLLNDNTLSVEEGCRVVENGGKYCVECNREAPVRSHHCPLCKICVLRKDHHCFITGACVGLGNQRYFILFLFWCFVGLSHSLIYLFPYMYNAIPSCGLSAPFSAVCYIGPVAIGRWFLGYDGFFNAALCSAFSFALAMLVSAGGFLGMQIYYTAHGYTMFEYHSLCVREAFDGDGENLGERFRLVMGNNYMLNFIFPMVWERPVLTPAIANNLFRVRSKRL